jgi:hypothetical protein
MRVRAPFAAMLAVLLAAAPALGVPVLAASVAPLAAAPVTHAIAAPPKVVIVVGATHEATASYRTYADQAYAEAIKYTPNVVKIYSPNATWSRVKAAAQGASILLYLGHGSGYPKTTGAVFDPNNHDGMGLNSPTDPDDYVAKYYGENYMANEIRLAKNAVVILSHLCYASGNSESGDPQPTYPVARARVDNFASGFLRAGARAVIADTWNSGVASYIRSIFTTDLTIGDMWRTAPSNHDHQMLFSPSRNPAYQAGMDPNSVSPPSGFYRSIVGAFDMRTTDVVAGAAVPTTSGDPASFQAPGAATAGSAAVPLYTDATLAEPTGLVLPASTKVRVADVTPGHGAESDATVPPAVSVQTFGGETAGWASGGALVPRDSAGPELWSIDGPTTISPNFDGLADRLQLVARFSEAASWSASIRDASDTVLRTQSGSGHEAFIDWEAVIGAAPAPVGDYTWRLHATDAWGNPALDQSGTVTVVDQPVLGSAVLSFKPSKTVTPSSTITYGVRFGGPVTGLASADFLRQGTAANCKLGAPAGGPADFTISVTGCSTGSVNLSLAPNSVTDSLAITGPAGTIAAPKVIIDRSIPTVTSPRVALRTGLQLGGASTRQPLPMTLTWTGKDSGSGVASYDVRRSVDGRAYVRIASSVTGTSLSQAMTPGHSYRFQVRARDRAGNIGSWVGPSTWYTSLIQQSSTSVRVTGTWLGQAGATYSGGSLRYATAAGAGASLTFKGRSIGWVTTRRPNGGLAKVYVDGALVATVDTSSDATTVRFVAFSKSWSSYASHTIRIVVLSGRIDLDAFAKLG